MRIGDGNTGLDDGNTDSFEDPCHSLNWRLRQGYHTGLPHVKPAPDNFLLRHHPPARIIPAGYLPPWMIHFHRPWLQNFVLDMGYTLGVSNRLQGFHR